MRSACLANSCQRLDWLLLTPISDSFSPWSPGATAERVGLPVPSCGKCPEFRTSDTRGTAIGRLGRALRLVDADFAKGRPAVPRGHHGASSDMPRGQFRACP